jgi:hypothetical protein
MISDAGIRNSKTTPLSLVRGLKLSFGIIAMTVVYAAVVTPVLVAIINRGKRQPHSDDYYAANDPEMQTGE